MSTRQRPARRAASPYRESAQRLLGAGKDSGQFAGRAGDLKPAAQAEGGREPDGLIGWLQSRPALAPTISGGSPLRSAVSAEVRECGGRAGVAAAGGKGSPHGWVLTDGGLTAACGLAGAAGLPRDREAVARQR